MIGAHPLRTSQALGIQAIAACWLVLPLSGYTFALPKEEPFGIGKDTHEHARQVLTGHVGKGLPYRSATVKNHLESRSAPLPARVPPRQIPAGFHVQSWPPRLPLFTRAKTRYADACHGWNRNLKRLPWQAISGAESASRPPPRGWPRRPGSAALSRTALAASKPARQVLVLRRQKNH